MPIAKIVSYLIVLVVFFVIVGFVFQQPLKELVTGFADRQLERLEDEAIGGAQGTLNQQVVAAKEFANSIGELVTHINSFKDDSGSCLIELEKPLSEYISVDSKLLQNVKVSFYSGSDEKVLVAFQNLAQGASGNQLFELDGIKGVHLIRDTIGVLRHLYAYNFIAFPFALENSRVIDSTGNVIQDFKGHSIFISEQFSGRLRLKRTSSLDSLILFEKGNFVSETGSNSLLLQTHILKYNNSLFFYNGNIDWQRIGNVNLNAINFDSVRNCGETQSLDKTEFIKVREIVRTMGNQINAVTPDSSCIIPLEDPFDTFPTENIYFKNTQLFFDKNDTGMFLKLSSFKDDVHESVKLDDIERVYLIRDSMKLGDPVLTKDFFKFISQEKSNDNFRFPFGVYETHSPRGWNLARDVSKSFIVRSEYFNPFVLYHRGTIPKEIGPLEDILATHLIVHNKTIYIYSGNDGSRFFSQKVDVSKIRVDSGIVCASKDKEEKNNDE